jgi:hypothetical protein
MTLQVYSINLDEMIKTVQTKGYSNDFKEFEKNRLNIEERKVNLTDRDGVDIDASSDYYNDSEEFDSSLSAQYDIFKYSAEYDHATGEIEEELIGIEKELKDIFFSDRKYATNIFSYDKKYRLNLENEKIEEDILAVISLYKTYMDTKLELDLKEKLHPGLVTDMKKLKKEFELGVGTEFDYMYSQMLVENSITDIKQLQNDIKKLRFDFLELYKINCSGEEIEDFTPSEKIGKENFVNIGKREIENSELLLDKSKENYKYSTFDNKWPDITAGTFYDTVDDQVVVSLELEKTLFEYDDTSHLYEVEIDELEKEKEKISNEINNLRKNYENKYFNLLKEVENLRRENIISEKKYEIYKLKYEQGTESYTDYIEKYDEYVENSITLKKKNNELNALIYEIKYRR